MTILKCKLHNTIQTILLKILDGIYPKICFVLVSNTNLSLSLAVDAGIGAIVTELC